MTSSRVDFTPSALVHSLPNRPLMSMASTKSRANSSTPDGAVTPTASIPWGGGALPLPAFFASVSSVKANYRPSEYLAALLAAGTDAILISAYDIEHAAEDREEVLSLLATGLEERRCIILDSGNYESYWHRDSSWTAERFGSVLETVHVPYAFCHDDQNPPSDPAQAAAEVIAGVLRDQEKTDNTTILPIVHGNAATFPTSCRIVAQELNPAILAVPERELGLGLLQRVSTVRKIVASLHETGGDTRLHLLGTGNPLSILLYCSAGAATFDGLEWCQTCADPETGRLYHFQQRELLHVDLAGHLEPEAYPLATLLHNLTFFRDWMAEIRTAIEQSSIGELLQRYLGRKALDF